MRSPIYRGLRTAQVSTRNCYAFCPRNQVPSNPGEDRCSKVFIVSGLPRTEANASQTPLSKLFDLKAEPAPPQHC